MTSSGVAHPHLPGFRRRHHGRPSGQTRTRRRERPSRRGLSGFAPAPRAGQISRVALRNAACDGDFKTPLVLVRIILPAAILLAGVILLIVHSASWLGATLVAISIVVWLANWLVRLGIRSQGDREQELPRELHAHGPVARFGVSQGRSLPASPSRAEALRTACAATAPAALSIDRGAACEAVGGVPGRRVRALARDTRSGGAARPASKRSPRADRPVHRAAAGGGEGGGQRALEFGRVRVRKRAGHS